ncbi:CAP-Gly domain-containing linker protein 1 [Leptopilina heterotoma]|uniref:CAP-Gly domain-containing linker protein 1 n=1 Tax=Leptopilina heterotoma TaxID=63436 RepID=UPI001CA93DF8|nr:CAP-Gly domain-containing linker protein 1 [Leptopilina heterotoma]
MSEDLLAKEKEFHKLNRELEEKTRELMKEVDTVMMESRKNNLSSSSSLTLSHQHYEFTSLDNISNKLLDAPTLMERQSDSFYHKKNTPTTFLSTEVLQVQNRNAEMKNFNKPSKCETISKNETVIELLKTKIKSQQTEIQTIQNEYKKKCNNYKELEIENKKQAEIKEKLQNQLSSLKESIVKNETINGNSQLKIHDQNNEISSLKKELEELRKEVKNLNQQSISNDVRLNRSLEENEKLRSALKFSKLDEKDLRDQIRKITEEKRQSIKNLEKQRSELCQAYKKQILLVDNLKKQKAFLEASRQIQITNDDFTKFLEWKPEQN